MIRKILSSHKPQRFKQITNQTNMEEPVEPESHFTKTLLTTRLRTRGTTQKLNNTLTNSRSPKRVDFKQREFKEARKK